MEIKVSITSDDEANQLTDPAKHFSWASDAIEYVRNTNGIAYSSFDLNRDKPIYFMSEQAYKYMLSKCNEDEAFDLGILGQSEEHAKSVGMPEKLKSLLNKFRK